MRLSRLRVEIIYYGLVRDFWNYRSRYWQRKSDKTEKELMRIKPDEDYTEGCTYCGGGDAVELAAGQGVHVEGKAFHTECVLAWGESQGFTADEMDALSEQAFG